MSSTSVALAFVLLVASGLLIRSFSNLMNADSGITALNVLSLEVALPYAGYNQAPRVRSFYQTVHDQLLAIPGVKAGVVTTDLPLRADGERRAFTPEGVDPSAARAAEHRADVGTRRLLLDVRHPAHPRPQFHHR